MNTPASSAANDLRAALGEDVVPPSRLTRETYLRPLIDEIKLPALQQACRALYLEDEYQDLETWPASLGFHHGYKRGLLIHTVEVHNLAVHQASAFVGNTVNMDVLIAAALWHDIAKLYDYRKLTVLEGQDTPKRALLITEYPGAYKDYWVPADYYKLIHHIPGSFAEFNRHAHANGVSCETIDAVGHCILAHHGPVREWGSPVAPQTLEALLLHQADMISAGYGATK